MHYCAYEQTSFPDDDSDFVDDPIYGWIHRPEGKPPHTVLGERLDRIDLPGLLKIRRDEGP